MRKRLVACVAVVLLLAIGLMALVAPRRCPVSRAAFERINQDLRDGMTLGDVESTFGVPPGDYRTRPHAPGWKESGTVARQPHIDVMQVSEWVGDDGAVIVHHFDDGTGREAVLGVKFEETPPYSSSLPGLVQWRLGKFWDWLP